MDIKRLAKPVAKFCKQKQVLPIVKVFKSCLVFCGLAQSLRDFGDTSIFNAIGRSEYA